MEVRTPSSKRGVTIVLIVLAAVVALGGVALLAFFAAGGFFLKGVFDEQGNRNREAAARTQVRVLEQAVEAFYVAHGSYPGSLAELTRPDAQDGDRPFVSADVLVDPWGKPYQFDPDGGHNGGVKPDVFTTSPRGTLIGNWGR